MFLLWDRREGSIACIGDATSLEFAPKVRAAGALHAARRCARLFCGILPSAGRAGECDGIDVREKGSFVSRLEADALAGRALLRNETALRRTHAVCGRAVSAPAAVVSCHRPPP